VKVEWSAEALADLDRFARFLHEHFPSLAAVVARELIEKAKLLAANPSLGVPISGREEYRQIIIRVLNASYILQYRLAGDRLIILRAFHSREAR
jgi:addiction module RelE/StbE family toxin